MRRSKAIRAYFTAFPKVKRNFYDEEELKEIEGEMQAIASAKTAEAACDVIRWWDCWGVFSDVDPEKDLLQSVRQIRKLMK